MAGHDAPGQANLSSGSSSRWLPLAAAGSRRLTAEVLAQCVTQLPRESPVVHKCELRELLIFGFGEAERDAPLREPTHLITIERKA